MNNAFSSIPISHKRPDVAHQRLQHRHISVLLRLLLDVPADELRKALAGDVSQVFGLIVEGKEVFEDDLDVGRVWLLGVCKEVNDLDEQRVEQLLRGVGSVSGDCKHCRKDTVEESSQVFLVHLVADHFLDNICYLRVKQLASHNLDVVLPVNAQPADSVEESGQIETQFFIEDIYFHLQTAIVVPRNVVLVLAVDQLMTQSA
jgi:hypothetical protein